MLATYVPDGKEDVPIKYFPSGILLQYTKPPERLKTLRLASGPAWLLYKLTVIMPDVSSYDNVLAFAWLRVLCVFFWDMCFAFFAFTDMPVRLMRFPVAS